MNKRKNRAGIKQLFAVLIIFCFTLLVAHTLYAQELKLGDIPLHPDVYKKHLKAYPTDFAAQAMDALPTSYDARTSGLVTSAKDQGSCGSCWAFASVGAMESHILKKDESAIFDLSEQQQVSCNTSQSGCCGGSMSAIRFWENQGSILETCFLYGEYNTSCPLQQTMNCNLSAACPQLSYRVINWGTLAESQFKLSLFVDGPSYFRFDVYNDFRDFWNGGSAGEVYVYQSGGFLGGHAVLLIGWDDAKSAYLCKNSWGESDGPNGDGTFWIAYSGHAKDLNFGMANFNLVGGCGDGVCDPGEDSCNCSIDCGDPPSAETICDNNTDDDCDGFTDCEDDDCLGTVECICDSDGVCELGEDCTNCPEDCISSGTDPGCGNGVCEPGFGEDCISCPSDCAGKQVGTAKRQFCCGDGDGNNPVGCEDDRCNTNEYTCISITEPYCCGDGTCEGAEDSENCLVDCPKPTCNDGICETGEDPCNCPEDCGSPPSSEENCKDGIDNDCDGLIDSNDPDCENECLPKGGACKTDSECCSNWCHKGACK